MEMSQLKNKPYKKFLTEILQQHVVLLPPALQ